ncbi:hypothetical protein RCC89_14330 [Cytophagaceae bacterium ABcell3]|nr:hypothetical protein RCC89_14330 [Cytophagaceae bacterium ABcell3]
MKIYKLAITSFLLLALSVNVWAQDDKDKEKEREKEEAEAEDKGLKKLLIFEKEAVLELPTAVRKYEKISFEKDVEEKEPLDYEFSDVELLLPDVDMKVKVPVIRPAELPKLYGNYVKAGFGNYVTPYFESYFNNKRNDRFMYGVHAKHLSSQRGPVEHSGVSENVLSAYGKYFLGSAALTGRLGYNRNMYNFYGFQPGTIVDRDTIRQVFNIFSASALLENTDKDAALDYKAGVDYFRLDDRFDAVENEVLGRISSSYKIDDNKFIDFKGVYSNSRRTDSVAQSRNYLLLQPGFLLTNENYSVRLGINTAWSNDTLDASGGVKVYPDIEVNYHFIPGQLTFFGGLTGQLERNVLRTFVHENPWLISDVPLNHTNKTLEIFAGAKGNVFEKLNYNARVSYATYQNLWFFANSAVDSSQFTILYDHGNSTVLNIAGDVSYDLSQRLRVGAKANIFNYSVNLDQPWHRPTFTGSINGSYNLQDKIFFNTDIYYISGITARNFMTGEDFNLPSIIDLNLKTEYRFSSAFSAFLEVNNILSRNYQRYLYYPVRGINVLGGLTYSF